MGRAANRQYAAHVCSCSSLPAPLTRAHRNVLLRGPDKSKAGRIVPCGANSPPFEPARDRHVYLPGRAPPKGGLQTGVQYNTQQQFSVVAYSCGQWTVSRSPTSLAVILSCNTTRLEGTVGLVIAASLRFPLSRVFRASRIAGRIRLCGRAEFSSRLSRLCSDFRI